MKLFLLVAFTEISTKVKGVSLFPPLHVPFSCVVGPTGRILYRPPDPFVVEIELIFPDGAKIIVWDSGKNILMLWSSIFSDTMVVYFPLYHNCSNQWLISSIELNLILVGGIVFYLEDDSVLGFC